MELFAMKTRSSFFGMLAAIWFSGLLMACARGQEAEPPNGSAKTAKQPAAVKTEPSPARASVAPNDASAARPSATVTNVSSRVADILRMHDAGVDARVIEAYVEHSPNGFNPTAADIIALHDHGISDTLIASIIQHGRPSRTQGTAVPATPAPAAALPAQPQPAIPY